ncbi:MAG: ArgE/DapE family deacylase [Nitrososphaerota archaeon]|nr:ArgE/DapE family deacylase [Nitrososphaerota archaeon]MDG6930478.1 ArgE/DapE family deacylase [Nitrososphaerota archaeon]
MEDIVRTRKILEELVSTPSVNPFDEKGEGERAVAQIVEKLFNECGVDVVEQDVVDNRYNVIGTLKGSRSGKRLIYNGHMDTVGVKGMNANPFSAELDEAGFLHGRGAADMKGGLAAMLAAMEALSKENSMQGELVVAAVVDEEYLGRGTQRLVKDFSASAGVVGEPTGMKIGVAHKGVARYAVEVIGKAAHGSSPQNGIDAIAEACKFISEIYKIEFKKEHQLLGKPVIHTSMISGGSEWSTVPAGCTIYVERRTIPGETEDDIIREASEIIQNIKSSDSRFNASVKLWKYFPPMQVQCEVVSYLQALVSDFKKPEIVGLPYWTDAATMNAAGIPTVVFGPGSIDHAHSNNEMVNLEEVHQTSKIYYKLAKTFLNH